MSVSADSGNSSSKLVLRTHRFDKFHSSAEVENSYSPHIHIYGIYRPTMVNRGLGFETSSMLLSAFAHEFMVPPVLLPAYSSLTTARTNLISRS